jgi:dimethylargininase
MTSQPTFARRFIAAVLSALAAAAAAQLATVFVFFATNQANPTQLDPINNYFLPSSLLFFVLLVIGGLLGAFRSWWVALVIAAIAAPISSFIGTIVVAARQGAPITSATLGQIFGTLAGNNLIFIIAAVISTVTAGSAIWRRAIAFTSSARRAGRVALVRLPSSTLASGELTHKKRVPVDQELADQQWEAYVAVLEAEGFSVMEVEAADSHPDSVFIEDTVVILGRTAIITSLGAESRRGELAAVDEAVSLLALDVERISLPGTLDGGDVLKVGSTVYVGRSGRTNSDGIRQFRAIAGRLGYSVVAVPVTKTLHLKSAVTALPDGTVIGSPALVDHPELFERFLAVPEAEGASVVVLADDAVLVSASAPKTAALIADLGYRVVTVDVSEFEKLEGCVTCLSVRIR